jgi:hypothetical protein
MAEIPMRNSRLLLLSLAVLLAGPALAAQPGARAAATDDGAHKLSQHTPPPAAAAGPPARSWTMLPLLAPGRTPPGDRSLARFVPHNLEAATVEVHAPDASADHARTEVPVGAQGAEFRAPKGQGNYYWLSARQQTGEKIVTASTVRYFSNPGPAPTELLLRRKGELELIPQPLPREHAQYRAGEERTFLVRFRGQPLAGAEVMLETEHGTRAMFKSDERGIARIAFPLDFKPQKPSATGEHAGHGPQRAGFALGVEHADGGVRHLTAFNYLYAPDAWNRKNLWAGLGFAVFGMLLAVPLLRRTKKVA